MADYSKMTEALIAGDAEGLVSQVKAALASGAAPKEVLNQGLIRGMDIVGEKMEAEDMFIPEVLMAAQAMGKALEVLRPLLAAEDVAAAGKIVIGTVKGDLHDIGKNLVAMLLESAGFEVANLGVDISPEVFVEEAKKRGATMICMSALLTTTMPEMKKVIETLTEKGLRDRVKVVVGGAPVDEKFAREIGADGYGKDAAAAVELCRRLVAA